VATIELTRVHRRFGAAVALDGLDLCVGDGEVVALLGPSGSGKTTALRLVAGFDRPDAGRVSLGGRTVADPARGVWVPPERRGVGMVFQDLALFPHLTVAGNVGFGLGGGSAVHRIDRVRRMLDLVGIGDLAGRYPHELSGGQQQRVALARALAPGPGVVLLDEPFASLDAGLRTQLCEEVGRILRAASATALFVTHDQEEALAFADRVAVLDRGRLEQVDAPHRVYHAPATRFVAGFVGQADFLAASPAGDRLDTEVGPLQNPGLGPEAAVEVMVRPDQVALAPDPAGPAVVLAHRFRGAAHGYTLVLRSGRQLRCERAGTEPLPIGARVRPSLRASAYLVFAAGRPVARVRLAEDASRAPVAAAPVGADGG
jgi:iron(III) transport system ATP-binding protein